MPLTSDNSIEVSVEELSGADYDEESSLVTWTFTLQPGEIRIGPPLWSSTQKEVIDGL